MLIKIWCFLFGHEYVGKDYGSEKAMDMYKSTGNRIWYTEVKNSFCPRCGKELK